MITIGFSSHHTEVLPYARQQMQQHRIVALEEPPPVQEFIEMLNRRV